MFDMTETQHKPVLMEEAIELLELKEGMVVFDATLGGGGYAREIYKKIMPGGTLIVCDQDMQAIERFKNSFPDIAEEIKIVHSNYSNIRKILKDFDIDYVDAIVADLGLSSDQMNETDRGFSFMGESKLDMRMDQSLELTAHYVVNEYSKNELSQIIRNYGDEKFANLIAKNICNQRPIVTSGELADIIINSIPNSVKRKQKIHPATKTFQAIRIEVNNEFENLKIFLTDGISVLQKSGYFSVVSFHSGEDKMVKNIFRSNARGCICDPEMPVCRCEHEPSVRVITRKPIKPSEKEISDNPRSRSARLRSVEKI
ncbi:MAG: 16S rRNA (cytosine(1402)-N(4))-methyltransferase RsmH [Candidatus Moraniibacteriota bacterium]|jgi:16S rRNA (cytosine1402-N4)-methyltransferase